MMKGGRRAVFCYGQRGDGIEFQRTLTGIGGGHSDWPGPDGCQRIFVKVATGATDRRARAEWTRASQASTYCAEIGFMLDSLQLQAASVAAMSRDYETENRLDVLPESVPSRSPRPLHRQLDDASSGNSARAPKRHTSGQQADSRLVGRSMARQAWRRWSLLCMLAWLGLAVARRRKSQGV